jgi:hypothetical protein
MYKKFRWSGAGVRDKNTVITMLKQFLYLILVTKPLELTLGILKPDLTQHALNLVQGKE